MFSKSNLLGIDLDLEDFVSEDDIKKDAMGSVPIASLFYYSLD